MSLRTATPGTDREPAIAALRGPRWLAVATLLYFVFGLLGRFTIIDGETMSMVWPAAGVAMLAFALAPRRQWLLISVLLALANVSFNLLTGAPPVLLAPFIAANLFQGVAAAVILIRLAPHLLDRGATEPLAQLRDFGHVAVASFVASIFGALAGALGLGLLAGAWSLPDLAVWWGRNAVGSVVIGTLGLLFLPGGRLHRVHGRQSRLLSVRTLEGSLLVALTVGLYLTEFVFNFGNNVTVPMLLPTVWAGLRFGPRAAALHGLAVSSAVVALTLAGKGAFASLESWPLRVVAAEVFIGLAFSLTVMLALGRAERSALTAKLVSARAAAEDQALLVSTIIDSMHDGVTVLNEAGQVQSRNRAGAELVRSPVDSLHDILEAKFALTADGQPLEHDELPWVRAFAGENVVEQDLLLVFGDGSPSRWLAVSAWQLPRVSEQGLRQAVLVYHDVTRERAQRSALESFAGVVAHDLRGPLSVASGWTELLTSDLKEQPTISREVAEPKLERIRAAVETMRQLVDDLLESATARDLELRFSVVDLDSVARTVASQHAAAAVGSVPVIEVATLPPVYADAALVRQLVDNLIGNAVKYAVSGEIARVRVSGRLIDDVVEITISDEGIGIPAEQRDEVFGAFQRADTVEGYAGHGIGLAVCKRIVEQHGGWIHARPPLGAHGVRIVFGLPGVAAATQPVMS